MAGVPRVPLAAPALFLALGNKKPLAIRAREAGTRCLRDGPGGRRPQQRGNAPGAPPRGSRALAPGPASRAPLPGARRGRGRRGRRGRQPEAGRPQAATGARPPAGGAARAPPERSGARGDSALDQLRAELVSAPWRPQGGPPRRPLLSRGFRPRGPPEGAEARGLFRDQESEGVQRQGARRWPSIFPGGSPLLH